VIQSGKVKSSFRLSVLFVALTSFLTADECKMWDFKATSAGNLGTLADLAMWNGGTEAQCELMRNRVKQSLIQRSDAARQRVQELFDRDLKNTTSSKPRSGQEILRDVEETAQAHRAEAQAQRAWMDLPRCACVARGESVTEKQRREERAQQANAAATRKAKSTADQRQRDEDDRARQAVARGEWEAREAKRKEDQAQREHDLETRLPAAHDDATRRRLILERDAALTRISRERAADVAPSTLPPRVPKSDLKETDEARNRHSIGETVLAEMRTDPFGRSTKAALRSNSRSSTPDDPTTWTEPFQSHKEETKEKVLTTAASVFEEGAKRAAQVLADNASQAAAKLPKAKAAAFIREANDVRSFMKGFERVFKYYDNAIGVAKIAGAETPDDRSRASWELGITLAQGAAKGGATWAIEMLPKRVASVLLGPVAWGGSIVLSSENTQIEPSDILQRPQDFSSEDKKAVLYHQAQAYAKYGDTWNDSQRSELVGLALLVKSKK
jgi:hypothetical protein